MWVAATVFFELWAARNGVEHITGIDMTESDLATAQRHVQYPQVAFKQGSAIQIPLENTSCHTVVSWEVIEHIPKGTEPVMFKEVHRVLRPGGVFYLSTPNGTLRSILGDPTYWMINHRHYTLRYFEKLAEQSGFRIVKHAVKAGMGRFSMRGTFTCRNGFFGVTGFSSCVLKRSRITITDAAAVSTLSSCSFRRCRTRLCCPRSRSTLPATGTVGRRDQRIGRAGSLDR
jgi:SAM-dependent methyltransferase